MPSTSSRPADGRPLAQEMPEPVVRRRAYATGAQFHQAFNAAVADPDAAQKFGLAPAALLP